MVVRCCRSLAKYQINFFRANSTARARKDCFLLLFISDYSPGDGEKFCISEIFFFQTLINQFQSLIKNRSDFSNINLTEVNRNTQCVIHWSQSFWKSFIKYGRHPWVIVLRIDKHKLTISHCISNYRDYKPNNTWKHDREKRFLLILIKTNKKMSQIFLKTEIDIRC